MRELLQGDAHFVTNKLFVPKNEKLINQDIKFEREFVNAVAVIDHLNKNIASTLSSNGDPALVGYYISLLVHYIGDIH